MSGFGPPFGIPINIPAKPDRLAAAEIIVGLFAMVAAVFALTATVLEIHHAFPSQSINIGVSDTFGEANPRALVTKLAIMNGRKSSIISSHRIEICLRNRSTLETVYVSPRTPRRTSQEAIPEPVTPSESPSGSWTQSHDASGVAICHWTRQSSDPWFPGMSLDCPEIPLDVTDASFEWHVRYWTDREGPAEEIVPVS
jgi:hypothetical protein